MINWCLKSQISCCDCLRYSHNSAGYGVIAIGPPLELSGLGSVLDFKSTPVHTAST